MFNIVKENKENIKKISKGVPVLGSVGAPKKKGGGLWGAVKGAGTFAKSSYGAYIVSGNTIMLCQVQIEVCDELVAGLK